jgi:ppGpp synthetase/RelA/SpoT-type nucleotidyltranferase
VFENYSVTRKLEAAMQDLGKHADAWVEANHGKVYGLVTLVMHRIKLPAVNDVIEIDAGRGLKRRYIVVALSQKHLVMAATALSGDPKSALTKISVGDHGTWRYVNVPATWTTKKANKLYDAYVETMKAAGNAALIIPFNAAEEQPEPPAGPKVPPSEENPDVTIEHTVENGTIAHFPKNREILGVLRRFGFVWAPRAGVVRRTNSVGLAEPTVSLFGVKRALNDAGFTVAFDIEISEDIEAAHARRREYLLDRADMVRGQAAKHAAKSDAAYDAQAQIGERFAGGQPIIMGHHSTRKSLADRDRMHSLMSKSVAEQRAAEHDEERARGIERLAARVGKPKAKRSAPRASQTSSEFLKAVIEDIKGRAKRETGATLLQRGYFGTNSINYTIGYGEVTSYGSEKRARRMYEVDVSVTKGWNGRGWHVGHAYYHTRGDQPLAGGDVEGKDASDVVDEILAALKAAEAAVTTRTNPTVKPTSGRPITAADYPGVFQDSNHDGIADVDDPDPKGRPVGDTVEEVRLAEELKAFIDVRQDFVEALDAVKHDLAVLAPGAKVKARVKSPFSMINKLRRARLLGPKGLTDVAGGMIVCPDGPTLDRVVAALAAGRLGRVREHEDFYASPKAGYRAHHFIVDRPGPHGKPIPVEIQVKTKRGAAIAAAGHEAYKRGRQDAHEMDRLSSLAMRADWGDRDAARAIDPLVEDEHALERALTRS